MCRYGRVQAVGKVVIYPGGVVSSNSEWLVLVELIWVALFSLVMMLAAAVLLMHVVSQRVRARTRS